MTSKLEVILNQININYHITSVTIRPPILLYHPIRLIDCVNLDANDKYLYVLQEASRLAIKYDLKIRMT